MKKSKKRKLQFRRVRHFKILWEMIDFIEKNNIRNFNSEFCEYKKVFVLHY